MEVMIHTDGGSRGNPGPSAIGVLIENTDASKEYRLGMKIGETTNNIAEYSALCKALELCTENGVTQVEVYLDSELVVKQIRGLYKVKNQGLRPYYEKVMNLIAGFELFSIHHVPRSENKVADSLVNRALDEGRKIEEGELFLSRTEDKTSLRIHDHNPVEEEAALEGLMRALRGQGIVFSELREQGDILFLKAKDEDLLSILKKRKKIVILVKEAGFHKVALDLEDDAE
ncbi:MAG: ribonuclease HI family protein [Filifactor alocis]|nr:ribonuclease HI family protein [Filifactor alocis]